MAHIRLDHAAAASAALTLTDTELRYVYCRAWNWKLWEPGGPISEDEARRRFAEGDEDDWFSVAAYEAAAEVQDIPSFVLEVTPRGETIRSKFYAPSRSLRREYIFGIQPDGRTFMDTATQWFYADNENHYRMGKAILIESFRFRPDGIVDRTIDDDDEPNIVKVSYRDVDVSGNWEDAPEFGDWARFGNEDR